MAGLIGKTNLAVTEDLTETPQQSCSGQARVTDVREAGRLLFSSTFRSSQKMGFQKCRESFLVDTC